MLKTSGSTESTSRPGKGRVGVGGDGGGNGGDDGGHDDEHSEHQWIYQLARPRLWLGIMGLIIEVNDAVGKSVKKSSKSRRIIKKVQKLQRSKKFAKAIDSEKQLPKHRSSIKELEHPFFLGLGSSLEATSTSIIDKAKLMELLILYHVVLQRSQDNFQAKDTRAFHQV